MNLDEVLAKAQRTPNTFLALTDARNTENTGPLAGVPFAVKDVFDVRGTRTTAASRVFDHRPPARENAEAVRRIIAAGAILIGKTTMSELAFSGLGVNERFGTPTLSRAGREYVVGGSSSGSAAAVHAGVVPFALGSDTSGSARIPATWTGVFGFRPSLGRYPSAGMTALAPTLDTVGVIADSLKYVETVDRILADAPPPVTDVRTPTFVVPHESYLANCDPPVLERFHADLSSSRAFPGRTTGYCTRPGCSSGPDGWFPPCASPADGVRHAHAARLDPQQHSRSAAQVSKTCVTP